MLPGSHENVLESVWGGTGVELLHHQANGITFDRTAVPQPAAPMITVIWQRVAQTHYHH